MSFELISLSGLLFCLAFFFAGVVDSITGGGGLITMPTMLALGVPVHYITGTLIIDELDAKIHPVLLMHIIMLFNNMKINRHGAQLIFTSHDLSTMNNEIFRRDEILFVAKGNDQNSKLYSLVEFKAGNGEIIRKDAKYDKQYLEGKYGADPYLRKIIDWGEIDA